MFNKGISLSGDILDLGAEKGIVKKAGSFYSYGDTRLGQGRENSKEFLESNKDLAKEIESQIRGETPVDEQATPLDGAS